MKFGPQRGCFVYIFEHLMHDFGLLFLAVAISLITGDWKEIWDNIPLIVIVLFAPVQRLFTHFFTYYSIDGEHMLIEKGWINKKKIEIPLVAITTVDFTQNLVHQMTNSYRIKVDNTGSVSDEKGRVELTLKEADAFLVKSLLTTTNDTETRTVYPTRHVALTELILLGLLQSKIAAVLQVLGLLAAGAAIVLRLLDIKENVVENVGSYFTESIDSLLLIVGGMSVLLVISGVYSAMITVVKFYGFQITDQQDALRIEYGLLTRKTFTLVKEKISGVRYRQSLLLRWMGYGMLEVFAIGYGDRADEEENETSMLYPYIRERELASFLETLIPEFADTEPYEKPDREALRYFFMHWSIGVAILCMVISLVVSRVSWQGAWMVGMFILLLTILWNFMDYKNTGIYGNARHISMTYGGLTRDTVFIKTRSVESIQATTSYWKKKRGVATICVGILAPAASATAQVRNVSLKIFLEIKDMLAY